MIIERRQNFVQDDDARQGQAEQPVANTILSLDLETSNQLDRIAVQITNILGDRPMSQEAFVSSPEFQAALGSVDIARIVEEGVGNGRIGLENGNVSANVAWTVGLTVAAMNDEERAGGQIDWDRVVHQRRELAMQYAPTPEPPVPPAPPPASSTVARATAHAGKQSGFPDLFTIGDAAPQIREVARVTKQSRKDRRKTERDEKREGKAPILRETALQKQARRQARAVEQAEAEKVRLQRIAELARQAEEKKRKEREIIAAIVQRIGSPSGEEPDVDAMLFRFNDVVYAMTEQPDEEEVVEVDLEGVIIQWPLQTGELEDEYEGSPREIAEVAVSKPESVIVFDSSVVDESAEVAAVLEENDPERVQALANRYTIKRLQEYKDFSDNKISTAVNAVLVAVQKKDAPIVWDITGQELREFLQGIPADIKRIQQVIGKETKDQRDRAIAILRTTIFLDAVFRGNFQTVSPDTGSFSGAQIHRTITKSLLHLDVPEMREERNPQFQTLGQLLDAVLTIIGEK
jgi:hypothetical protein